jgi:hypothetical protein
MCKQGLVEKINERDHWIDPGVDGRITPTWIIRGDDVRVRTGFIWFRVGTVIWHL